MSISILVSGTNPMSLLYKFFRDYHAAILACLMVLLVVFFEEIIGTERVDKVIEHRLEESKK